MFNHCVHLFLEVLNLHCNFSTSCMVITIPTHFWVCLTFPLSAELVSLFAGLVIFYKPDAVGSTC